MRPEKMALLVATAFSSAVRPLRDRVQLLEAELATLKADLSTRPPLRARGVWQPHKSFALGDAVTFDGSLWVCTKDHIGDGRFPHECFKLAVKRGRDARDAK
jgi:hypothetical protein